MQKAAVLERLNEFPKIRDVEDELPGDNDVIIEQDLTGVCYRDILTMEGHFPRVVLPIVPGHEISGRIKEVGKNVRKFKKGDRVASLIYVPCGKCEFCKSGRENLCRYKKVFGEELQGAYRKYVRVPEISLVKVPENVPPEAATIAACVTGMVVQALETVGQVREGDTVLITGSGGGVGAHAIQIAKAMGATVIGETSSEWKKERILGIGADYVVSGKDFHNEVKRITGGKGVDVVLETVGGPTFNSSFRSLNYGGRIVVIGNVNVSALEVPTGNLILKGNSVSGSISSTKSSLRKALRLTSQGKIRVVVGGTYTLDRVEDAYRAMKNKELFGRAFIKL
ncbi:MAG: alcohol dehydrogenase catalytic domain-containing protein [Thermoplasmatales archaeon]